MHTEDDIALMAKTARTRKQFAEFLERFAAAIEAKRFEFDGRTVPDLFWTMADFADRLDKWAAANVGDDLRVDEIDWRGAALLILGGCVRD